MLHKLSTISYWSFTLIKYLGVIEFKELDSLILAGIVLANYLICEVTLLGQGPKQAFKETYKSFCVHFYLLVWIAR